MRERPFPATSGIPSPLPRGGRGDEFTEAYTAWQALARQYGPARAYKPALKLPDLARGEGEAARQQADWAVGSMLFWMGRFQDAIRWLPECNEREWARALLGETVTAQNPCLHFFRDEPAACLAALAEAAEPAVQAGVALLHYWARACLDEPADESATQQALALLRRLAPSDEARGMAIYALAAFRQHPVYALPHLDHALDLGARFGLHHLDARLYKAQQHHKLV